MIKHGSYESKTWEIIRQQDHIEQVLAEIEVNFAKYFKLFWAAPKKQMRAIQENINGFLSEQLRYQEILDSEVLEEYDDDPNAFKGAMRTDIPIIRRALHSPDESMKEFKKSFNLAKGIDLLRTTQKIVEFAEAYMADFDDEPHEMAETIDDLRISILQEDGYTTSKVIGEGIKSRYLYMLYPNAFPNRGQNAIWSLYFLSGRKEFGLKDYSEFLMVNPDPNNNVTEQNYLYPFDIFCFYALKIYLLLKECSEKKKNYSFTNSYRYIYLEHFFNFVTDYHREDINFYKITSKGKESAFI